MVFSPTYFIRYPLHMPVWAAVLVAVLTAAIGVGGGIFLEHLRQKRVDKDRARQLRDEQIELVLEYVAAAEAVERPDFQDVIDHAKFAGRAAAYYLNDVQVLVDLEQLFSCAVEFARAQMEGAVAPKDRASKDLRTASETIRATLAKMRADSPDVKRRTSLTADELRRVRSWKGGD